MSWEGAAGQSRAAPSHPPQSDQSVPSPNRSQLQTPSSYGPVLSPMNKVHGGGINKLPSVNQLVGQPAQHGSSSAPSLGPMGTSSVSRLGSPCPGVGVIMDFLISGPLPVKGNPPGAVLCQEREMTGFFQSSSSCLSLSYQNFSMLSTPDFEHRKNTAKWLQMYSFKVF